jgi:hypothetical protein
MVPTPQAVAQHTAELRKLVQPRAGSFKRGKWPSRFWRGLSISCLLGATEATMSVAKVSEISATSTKSFEDAIQQGLARATHTLRNIRSAWIKEQHVRCEGGKVKEYQVNMMVTFVLDD